MRLNAYLTAYEISSADFSRTVGVSPSLVHGWLRGTKLPSIPMARRVKIATKGLVTESDWLGELTAEELAPGALPPRTARREAGA